MCVSIIRMPLATSLLVVLTVMFPLQSQAWVGGPFSNNSALRVGTDGVYRASITGKNTSGVARFVINSNSPSIGQFTIFHEGLIATGATDGLIDHERKLFTSTFNGFSLTGFFNAKIKSTGRSFLFDGKGKIQSTRSATVPTARTGVDDIIVNPVTGSVTVIPRVEAGDAIPLFTKIKVRGLRTGLPST